MSYESHITHDLSKQYGHHKYETKMMIGNVFIKGVVSENNYVCHIGLQFDLFLDPARNNLMFIIE